MADGIVGCTTAPVDIPLLYFPAARGRFDSVDSAV